MPGPAGKPDAVRRNARVGIVKLPASGRKGRPPAWPLPGRMRAGEKALWRELWHTPQAVAWEDMGWTRVVARYCRLLAVAENAAAETPASRGALAEARQLEDRLGMTPKSMRMLLWQITPDEIAEKREAKAAETARERIKAVG